MLVALDVEDEAVDAVFEVSLLLLLLLEVRKEDEGLVEAIRLKLV